MSKPAGTKSYVSMTLSQLAEYFGPDDPISVQRVVVEKRVVAKAMNNFSTPQTKETSQESNKPEESLFAVESFEGENDK